MSSSENLSSGISCGWNVDLSMSSSVSQSHVSQSYVSQSVTCQSVSDMSVSHMSVICQSHVGMRVCMQGWIGSESELCFNRKTM